MGSLVLRPVVSQPPRLGETERLNPANLNASVARKRPAGRYTLNRQLEWEAPFILQDNERLSSAYAHLNSATGEPLSTPAHGREWLCHTPAGGREAL
jgi:hypothetical protein